MSRADVPRKRCAIYTRKSSEEGLEQEFNSLHAQREACEAYIKGQRHEGWVALPAAYDDGGFSGGNLQRPGLQRLLYDVREGRVDVIVTYKVDRLTRSLADFARLIETFDTHEVSFVSVTQQFNTTSSMGRLTLNVLLRERLAELGHQPAFGRELVGFEQDAEGVTAQVGDEIVRARYLVGTDGGRSLVRHVLGIDFPGETLGIGALVADVALDGINRDAWHRFGSGPRQVSLCPLAGTELFQIQGSAPLEGDVDVSAGGLAALVAERTGLKITIHSVAWASVYSMNARLADRYRVGRVFLAGDAAHTHPPTGAQGLNGVTMLPARAGEPESVRHRFRSAARRASSAALSRRYSSKIP